MLLIGLPGSGKSTLARPLSAQLEAAYICRDAIRAAMFPDCRFTQAEKRAANTAVEAAAAAVLERGGVALIDGMTFARRSERETMRRIADESGAWLQGFYLACAPATAQARIGDTAHPARDRDAALVAEVAARFEVPDEPDVHHLDATNTPAALLREVLAKLCAPA